MATTPPALSRTTRPKPRDCSLFVVKSVTTPAFFDWASTRDRSVPALSSGISAFTTKIRSELPSRASAACSKAWPVPSGSACSTNFNDPPAAPPIAAPSGGTIRYGSVPVASRHAPTDHRTIGRPAIGSSSFGTLDRMRVPRPAARMTDSHRTAEVSRFGRT